MVVIFFKDLLLILWISHLIIHLAQKIKKLNGTYGIKLNFNSRSNWILSQFT